MLLLSDQDLDMTVHSNLLLKVDSPTATDTQATDWTKLLVLQRRMMNTLAAPIAQNYTSMFQTDTHKPMTNACYQSKKKKLGKSGQSKAHIYLHQFSYSCCPTA